MMKFLKFTINTVTVAIFAFAAPISQASETIEQPEKVQFITPSIMADIAKDIKMLSIMNAEPRESFNNAYDWGNIVFRNQLKVDGFGAGLIIMDMDSEPDHGVNNILPDGYVFADLGDKIAHGATVAAAAASKDPSLQALACGANIYPISPYSTEEYNHLMSQRAPAREAIRKLMNDIHALKEEKEALELKSKELKQSGNNVESYKVFEDSMRADGKIWMLTNQVNQLIGASNETLNNHSAVLNMGALDRIEAILHMCRDRHLPMPRVINMSLMFETNKDEVDTIISRLTNILQANDLLLVISLGNDGQQIQEKSASLDDGPRFDLRERLYTYPELCKNVIMSVAYFEADKIGDYSSRAGICKDHTIIARGNVFNTKTFNQDGYILKAGEHVRGTSFASPRIAALAVILGKYFPQFSMQQIKKIILNSAYKPQNFIPEEIGQGALNPLQAWIDAVQLEQDSKPTTLNKILGWFSSKKK